MLTGVMLRARAVTAGGDLGVVRIAVERGLLAAVLPAAGPADLDVPGVLVPGFVDTHAHGALGADFATCDVPAARAAAAFHASRGTTALVASIATAPLPETLRALERLAPLVAEGVLAGLHLEGPYLSPDRRGAHAAALLRHPDPAELDALVDAAGGAPLAVTLAPELPGALAAVRRLADRGARVLIGHTAGAAATAAAALRAGASGATHLFNGMPPVTGREPGPVGALLPDPRALLELIGDGVHLADATVDLVRRVAPGRTALVSDAMAATGLGDGDHLLAGSAVRVRDGVARTAGGSLAGSTAPLERAVLRLLRRGAPLPEVVALSSGAARTALGLPPALAPGSSADLVQLVDDDDGWRRGGVLRRGQVLADWLG